MVRDKQEQLEWEARVGPFAAGAAVVAALAPVVSAIALNALLPTRIHNDVQQVQALAHHSGAFAVGTAISAVGWLAFILPLWYLLRATAARISAPNWVTPLILLGPVLLVAALIFGLTDVISRAQDALPVTKPEAHDLLRSPVAAARGLGFAGGVATAASFVLVCTYAGRAGLLSRFMTIMGAIVGALTLFGTLAGAGSLGGPIVLFWGIALAMLFLGRWPGGRGPAWPSGEAIPWPSAQQRAALAEEANADADADADADGSEAGTGSRAAAVQQPNPRAARKRKKKKARR